MTVLEKQRRPLFRRESLKRGDKREADALTKRKLLGVRHPKEWGGRGMDWVTASAVCEEIGSLSYELACVFGVGADLVCDAIIRHGTDAQRERLADAGCDFGQGYLFSPPLPEDAFFAYLATEPQ